MITLLTFRRDDCRFNLSYASYDAHTASDFLHTCTAAVADSGGARLNVQRASCFYIVGSDIPISWQHKDHLFRKGCQQIAVAGTIAPNAHYSLANIALHAIVIDFRDNHILCNRPMSLLPHEVFASFF